MEHKALEKLFRQQVTLYHAEYQPEFICTRQVLEGVAYQWNDTAELETMGRSRSNRVLMGESLDNSALLVIPGWNREQLPELALGDKVLPGAGEEIASPAQWAALVPSARQGLTVIRQITPRQWEGRTLLLEAKGE